MRLVAAETEALGPVAAERQHAITGRLAHGLVTLRDYLRRDRPELTPIGQVRALAIVGAITEVLQHALHTTGIESLAALEPELATIVLALLEAPPG